MPVDAIGSVPFVLLSYLGEVTHWWGLVVIAIGFERVFKLERGSAVLSVLLPWILVTAVMAGFRLISGV